MHVLYAIGRTGSSSIDFARINRRRRRRRWRQLHKSPAGPAIESVGYYSKVYLGAKRTRDAQLFKCYALQTGLTARLI